MPDSADYLSTLHRQINEYFNFSEVRTLCFYLGVDYDDVPGNNRSAFVRNLIVSLARKGALQRLVDRAREERPFLEWPNVPADFTLPASIADEDIRQVVNYHVYGDKIDVGNIENAQGVAIGRGATATVGADPAPTLPPAATLTVEEAMKRVNIYLQLLPAHKKAQSEELRSSMMRIRELAQELEGDAKGIADAVARFVTAVN
jgi:hypothetical protein